MQSAPPDSTHGEGPWKQSDRSATYDAVDVGGDEDGRVDRRPLNVRDVVAVLSVQAQQLLGVLEVPQLYGEVQRAGDAQRREVHVARGAMHVQ